MNPNKALWEKGDFTAIAATMRQSGEALVNSLGIKPPIRVLDLGCGDGTTALPLAQKGAEVVGIDIARNLVEAGNKRAAQAGLTNLKFQEGDACHLEGVADHSFDLSLSCFGAMFAPKPFDVAKEMVRVTKPGGRVVMGNWIPNDPTSFVSQLLKISSAFTPPPPEGFISPMTWGVESHIVERFGQAGVEGVDGQGHLHIRLARQGSGGSYRCLQTVLRSDHERLRCRAKERQGSRAARPACRVGKGAKQRHGRRDLDHRDVHARDRQSLTANPGDPPRNNSIDAILNLGQLHRARSRWRRR